MFQPGVIWSNNYPSLGSTVHAARGFEKQIHLQQFDPASKFRSIKYATLRFSEIEPDLVLKIDLVVAQIWYSGNDSIIDWNSFVRDWHVLSFATRKQVKMGRIQWPWMNHHHRHRHRHSPLKILQMTSSFSQNDVFAFGNNRFLRVNPNFQKTKFESQRIAAHYIKTAKTLFSVNICRKKPSKTETSIPYFTEQQHQINHLQ